MFRTKGSNSAPREVIKRQRKNFNLEAFKQKASMIDWTPVLNEVNVDLSYDKFETNIRNLLDEISPMKKVQITNKHKSWLKYETRILIVKRDLKKEEARITNDDSSWMEYRKLRNECTSLVRKDKIQQFKDLHGDINDRKDTRDLYREVKSQLGWNNCKTPETFLVDGRAVHSPVQLANLQLEYFNRKIKQLIDNLPPLNADPCKYLIQAMEKWRTINQRTQFNLREITQLETVLLLKKMGNSKSFGHDQIDSWSLKLIASHIYVPLQHIINISIRSSKFANKWKIARVVPLFKGGKLLKTSPASFRPISLLSITAKLVERAVQTQLSKFMEESGQMSQNSHAYRMYHSTTTALLQISDLIFTATDKNLITALTTIDESSAFDCVQHTNLIRKLKLYNCSEQTCNWMSSYLSHRTQYVLVGAHQSIMTPVNVGVPQGSVLGPLLYSIYTNEIGKVIKDDNCEDSSHAEDDCLFTPNCNKCGAVPFYADDAMILFSSNSRVLNQLKIEMNLNKMKSFLNSNNLSLNMSKTKLIEIMIKQKRTHAAGSPPSLLTIGQDGQQKVIGAEKNLRILGGNFQDNLSWQAHLMTGDKAILPVIRQKLGALRYMGKHLPRASRMTLATGMIVSRINYIIQVWGGTERKYLKKVQVFLNDAARFVTGLPRRTSTAHLMTACNWLYVKELARLPCNDFNVDTCETWSTSIPQFENSN